jgi:hypothetical protein
VRETGRFSVYVIRLRPAVWGRRAMRERNPGRDPRKPCVYVGMTARTPEERLANHLSGRKGSRYVKAFGVALVPRLYARFNPMTYEQAKAMEVELARRLRNRGYAVWQN